MVKSDREEFKGTSGLGSQRLQPHLPTRIHSSQPLFSNAIHLAKTLFHCQGHAPAKGYFREASAPQAAVWSGITS